MRFPMNAQILDGESERRIHITNKHLHFILPAVWVQDIAVAEAMCIIVTDYCDPLLTDSNFQLHDKVLDRHPAASVLLPARAQ
jgi:hypothetical protein